VTGVLTPGSKIYRNWSTF